MKKTNNFYIRHQDLIEYSRACLGLIFFNALFVWGRIR